MLLIRPEEPGDAEAIRRVLLAAFADRTYEADLVDALRAADKITLSLVAEDDGVVIGHILFTPMTVDPSTASFKAIGLGPLAVLPSDQRRGIGSRLVRTGVAQCLRDGADCIFVLGASRYYKRFGFESVAGKGVTASPDIPIAHLQVIEAWEGAIGARPIRVAYAPEFSEDGRP